MQVHYFVDCQPVHADQFFGQGWQDFDVFELVEVAVAPVHGELQRWHVSVAFESRLAFVQHAQHAEHVVRVQERAFAGELSSL